MSEILQQAAHTENNIQSTSTIMKSPTKPSSPSDPKPSALIMAPTKKRERPPNNDQEKVSPENKQQRQSVQDKLASSRFLQSYVSRNNKNEHNHRGRAHSFNGKNVKKNSPSDDIRAMAGELKAIMESLTEKLNKIQEGQDRFLELNNIVQKQNATITNLQTQQDSFVQKLEAYNTTIVEYKETTELSQEVILNEDVIRRFQEDKLERDEMKAKIEILLE